MNMKWHLFHLWPMHHFFKHILSCALCPVPAGGGGRWYGRRRLPQACTPAPPHHALLELLLHYAPHPRPTSGLLHPAVPRLFDALPPDPPTAPPPLPHLLHPLLPCRGLRLPVHHKVREDGSRRRRRRRRREEGSRRREEGSRSRYDGDACIPGTSPSS